MSYTQKGGWGFKINYDREITADTKLIEQMTRLIEKRWFHPTTMITMHGTALDISGFQIGLIDLALMDATITAPELGLSLEDLADLACVMDRDLSQAQLDGRIVVLPNTPPGAYKRGDAIIKRLEAIWDGCLYTEEMSRKILKKAKADLARHKRNKAKYA